MSNNSSVAGKRTTAAVLAALPVDGIGMTEIEVSERLQPNRQQLVNAALRQLCETGEARFTGPNGKRRYFRVQA